MIPDTKRLMIYLGESDLWHHQPAYMAILEFLKGEGCAGATVVRGIAGFGASSRIKTAAILRLSMDLPVVITVVDREDRIERVLPRLKEMVGSGLMTLEDDRRRQVHADPQARPSSRTGRRCDDPHCRDRRP